MSVNSLSRHRTSSRVIAAYVLALLLPPLSVWCTQRFTSLHLIPFALDFVAITAVASMGGISPALLTLAVCFLDRLTFSLLFPSLPAPEHYDLARFLVLISAACIVSLTSGLRQRSERKLKAAVLELQDRTQSLMDALTGNKCACWVLDLDSGRSARWFAASYELFGRPYAELEQMPSLLPLLHPDDQQSLRDLIRRMRSTHEPLTFDHRVIWPNGEVRSLEMRGTRVPGAACVWRGLTVDITDRKLTEAALLRAEKLAAMGRLASTVAHEINNPLEAVTNLLYLARSDDSIQPLTQTYLATAERELARLSNITRLTLGFVRTSGNITDITIAPIVDEVLSIFQHRLESNSIIIERNYQPGIRIHVAPHELRQIATNLISNASDAIGHNGGRIRLSVAASGTHAIFCVEDTGSGIAPANFHRIFEPFFSTKEETGTGIGLWVTRELTEKSGGTISVESSDLPNGFHTRFRIQFPLAQD